MNGHEVTTSFVSKNTHGTTPSPSLIKIPSILRHTKFKTFLADNIFLAAENFNNEAKWLYAELLFLLYIFTRCN